MNREIKLRAWNEIISEMVYEKNTPHNFGRLNSAEILRMYDNVMQFTGLYDNTDKEIYEGDILQFYDSDDVLQQGEVTFKYGSFCIESDFMTFYRWTNYSEIAVIGNIYENPNLLSGGEK